jgi:hypothetical protein
MKKAAEWAIRNPFWVTALTCAIFYLLPFKPKPFGDGDYHIGTIQLIDFILNGFSGNVMVNKGLLSLFCYLPAYAVAYPFHSDAVYFTFGVILQCFFICMAVKLLFDAFALMGFQGKPKFLYWCCCVCSLFMFITQWAFFVRHLLFLRRRHLFIIGRKSLKGMLRRAILPLWR